MKAAIEIEALRELSEEELIDRFGEVCRFMRDLKEENQNILSLIEWDNNSEIEGGNYKAFKREAKRQFILKRVNGKPIANKLPQTLRDKIFEPVTIQVTVFVYQKKKQSLCRITQEPINEKMQQAPLKGSELRKRVISPLH